ncbi:MAG TPA: hypothetical protein VHW00_24755 [Thermoanaerobaculia bacterium]|nr:hypothetical protein [Thermoanaerobaculia bacterium]
MALCSTEVIDLLARTDWTDVAPRALAFTHFCMATHGHVHNPSGRDAHQYVTRAVFEIISGRHALHTASVFNAICGIVYANVKRDAARRVAARV